MKMEEGMEISIEELEVRKNQKKLSDMVSSKLGQLLLQGYRMLNTTCDDCGKKDQPTYCVQCEDPDCQKFMNAHFKSTLSEVVPEVMKQEPVNVALSNKPLSLPVPIEYTPNGNFSATLEALNAKINWASNELRNSHIVKYNIELCEMIKAASEAMIALKRV